MAFRNSILGAAGTLVRQQMQSEGFITGQFGWQLQREGDAEFNNVLIRGTIQIGGPLPQPLIELTAALGLPEINFYTGNVNETGPADIGAAVSNSPLTDQPYLRQSSPETSEGSVDFRMAAPFDGTNDYGFYFINDSTASLPGVIQTDGDLLFRLGNGTNLNAINSTQHGFQMGASTGFNMAGGNQEFQARNNNATTTMFLNRFGGTVQSGAAIAAGSFLQALGTGTSIIGQTNTRNIQLTASTSGIQAVNNGVATSLLLNDAGGNVLIGGPCTMSGGSLNVSAGNITASGSINAGTSFNVAGSQLDNQLSTAGGTIIGTAILGNGNLQWRPPAAGGTANVNAIVQGGGDYRLRLISSTRRHKENIKDLTEYTTKQILALKPRWFQRNDEVDQFTDETIGYRKDNPWYAGFIAEEAAELGLESFIVRNPFAEDKDEEITGFGYDQFAAVAHQVVLRELLSRIEKIEEVPSVRTALRKLI